MVGVNTVTILCRRLVIIKNNEAGLQWLIGSPFFSPFTIVSTFKCIHTLPSSPLSPDFPRESGDLRALLPKGFEVIGALIAAAENSTVNAEAICSDAVDAVRKLRKSLIGNNCDDIIQDLVGGVVDSNTGNVQFFASRTGNSNRLEPVSSIVYEEEPEKYVWERGCLLKCELSIKLPVYYQKNNPGDLEDKCTRGIEAVVAKFRNPRATYMLEALQECSNEAAEPIIFRGSDLDVQAELMDERLSVGTPQGSNGKTLSCLYFCLKDKAVTSVENADKIQVDILFSESESSLKPVAPVAEYVPGEAKFMAVDYKLEVLCYAAKDLRLTHATSKLVIPALVDQLYTMKNMILPDILSRRPQLHPYHFNPPGFLHPITAIYELSYGETEMKQVEIRKALHSRLGLPFDRPLLRIASAMNFSTIEASRTNVPRKGTPLLKDVHIGIPGSGVTGGIASLVQGSYEYYHYLQGGFDDSGWGCAYRSLQTIVSWFKLQQYTSIDVPSHREIQHSLVEIGDKDPSFTGSREWIGAIELSFVLDKLLGVSCKVINVRSGDELPEKCRELALHFQTQGTPIMIGGGVLAYTLLGVDYSDSTGDCAFLILDPHYTGTDELKKIVNGGWCGWKKAVDSKGKHFFLQNKFYNLLLPQRPNMV